MSDTSDVLVFDTGPLSHFARSEWLGVLKAMTAPYTVVIPDMVEEELRTGAARDARLRAVLDAPWVERVELRSSDELHWFAQFSERLVVRERNLGETAVLAYAKANMVTAVLDDGAARRIARDFDIARRPTLSLLCEAVRQGLLTIKLVSALADDLIATQYHLPFPPGGFEGWASDNGML
jgi:predicted nucleic acid-binding protein